MPWDSGLTLILGADGFIGRHLVEYCLAHGWDHYPISRSAGDFTQAGVAEAAFADAPRATRILHAITKQRTGPVQYDIQGELLADNARIHLNVLEAWRRLQPQAKLISLGSSCAYPESPAPQDERHFGLGVPHPSVLGYAQAKKVLAVGCETYGRQYGLNWLHCVLATVYGPYAHVEPQRAHFMAAMIDRAVHNRRAGATSFTVWGDPGTVRDLLYITDQIDAILAADAAFDAAIINCSANAPVTTGGCAAAILAAMDWDVPLTTQPGSFQGTPYKSLDATKLRRASGWQPKVAMPQGIMQVLARRYRLGDMQ